MFGTKLIPTVDKKLKEIKLVLLVAELFFPQRDENEETDELVQ